MIRRWSHWIATAIGLLVATSVVLPAFRAAGRITTADRNGDGRPDVWRTYDAEGRLLDVAVDSNFDGRSDVHEIYVHGDLIRRESDRNFDDRVDLVEDFDATTHEHVRSTVDADFDGRADLLVLFQDGRPAYSSWIADRRQPHASSLAPVLLASQARRGNEPLVALTDPFGGDTAFRTNATVAPPTAVAIVPATPAVEAISPAPEATIPSAVVAAASWLPRGPTSTSSSPRAPPLA
jgi:hypothetical protein